MKAQSIYFLQALWDVDAGRNKLLKIAKDSMLLDIKKKLGGMLDENTIWNSEKAQGYLRDIREIQTRVEQIKKPNELIAINEEFLTLSGRLRALQIKTSQSLNSAGGVNADELHVIVKQLIPFALNQVKKQTTYQMYRYLVLGGKLPDRDFYYPEGNYLQEWLYFYKNKLMPLFTGMDDDTIDSRWAYERRLLEIDQGFYIEQFIKVKPEAKELHQPLGIPGVGSGKRGEFRIFGRGDITNFAPVDFKNGLKHKYYRQIPNANDFIDVTNENSNPREILNDIFGNHRYLISPDAYFEYINKCILARTFHQRLKVGSCFCCGSPLVRGVCSQCGRRWRV